jgi:hypothetical protein
LDIYPGAFTLARVSRRWYLGAVIPANVSRRGYPSAGIAIFSADILVPPRRQIPNAVFFETIFW